MKPERQREIVRRLLALHDQKSTELAPEPLRNPAGDYTSPEQFQRGDHVPVMDGKAVFKMATTRMIEVATEVMKRNNVTVSDLSLVLMHQANMRINEYSAKQLGVPPEKVIHNIERYGNTTAAAIPLLYDEAARTGRIKEGDLILTVAFGAGMNWGASLMRA